MNWNTDSHDKRLVYFQKWVGAFVFSKSATSTSDTISDLFFCLSCAQSCMLSHANHLPCHRGVLELKNERISYWRCLEEKVKSFPWVTLLRKTKVNIWKPIVGTKRKRKISLQNKNLDNESSALYLLLRSTWIVSKQHPAIPFLLI